MNNNTDLNKRVKAIVLAGGMGMLPLISSAAIVGSLRGGDITLADGTTLIADQSSGDGYYGILVTGATAAEVTAGSGSTVTVKDPEHYAKGIFIQAANSNFTADKLILNVSGISAVAMELSGKQVTGNLGSGSSVTSIGSGIAYAEGVVVSNQSSLQAEALSISTQGTNGIALRVSGYGSNVDLGNGSSIQTNGTNSHGVQVDTLAGDAINSAATLKAEALTINTLGDASQGINIQDNGSVDLGSNSTIITTGKISAGIWSLGELTADHLTISTSGTTSPGISARENSLINVGAGSVISSAQTGGLVAMDSNVTLNFSGSEEERNTIQSGGYGASAQSTGAVINLANTDIVLKQSDMVGRGLWSLGGGEINGEDISITGPDTGIGVVTWNGGQTNLTGDLSIDMTSPDGVAIATLYAEGLAPGVITSQGKAEITGSVVSQGGLIDLNLEPGSLWSGSATSDNVNGGHLNVSLTNSTWNVSQTSNLDNLTLNNSLADLSAATDDATYSTLTIANLSGSGNFTLRTNLVGDGEGVNNTGDKIVVTESSAGEYGLNILNRGSAITTGNEVLTVVETTDGIATFRGNTDVELGGYVYSVNKQGTNWVLSSPKAPETSAADEQLAIPADNNIQPVSDENPSADQSPVVPTDNIIQPASDEDMKENGNPTQPAEQNHNSTITSTANAGANFLNIGYLMNYAEMQTLMQRMGDVRQGKTGGNVWLRGMDGRFSGFANGKLSNFHMNYSGYQFGIDKRLSDDLPIYLGLFMGATEGSPHYRAGDGTTKSEHFGIYGTWLNDAGFYLDGVLKFNRLRNQFDVSDTQNNRVSGHGVSSGLSGSLEAGKKFSFSDELTGFYVEPQLQLTAGHQDGTSVRASNGLNIDLSSYKSLMGRASVLAGYEVNQSNYKLNTYVKTGALREFGGDAAFALNGSDERLSFKGNGWNNGIGVSAQISNHTLFIEGDMVNGNRFDQRQVNAGYRFSF
ncbi:MULTISPECIES: autotransporter outer membrane beta-barrel domain-containing protein [Pantoea]|uniref:Autotransporter outer membrane beta-barrel domain-containing protein n=1 Tax=Candidatus Pantoea gossypiicola TaxID=2608008 RepID=A0AB34CMQ3_9GAMM|nr:MULTISPECIES: autotransporter outer membrane beta-barrel domain-containing protein [Pantoea]KAA5927428.1 autotransporter outer membrane beta-barrel domain-containing protein [Pantoea sp. VH_8]KAA5931767.1 autotransporter outer membrane beta-barrel domain-containing protein [Pantoea sp. VH_4]KAA5983400.1 autotransporter outer membrane beta-barrel domain-containing protein [Pantoea sp. M_4]KAA6121412.1 autotransporter outer membrane beta-barrel domain-containing protein [Pantoea gossypiicola]